MSRKTFRTAVPAAAVLFLAACGLSPDYGGTAYRCDQQTGCPGGFVCDVDTCVPAGAQDPASDGGTVADAGGELFVVDHFERALATGWGSPDTGDDWSVGPEERFSVAGGRGRAELPGPAQGAGASISLGATDVDLASSIASDGIGTGGGIYVGLRPRQVGSVAYQLKVVLDGGQVSASLAVDLGTDEVFLESDTFDLAYVLGDGDVRARIQVEGTSPTLLRGRVWQDGEPEPTTWQLEATDDTAELQVAADLGVSYYLSGSADDASVTVFIDDLVAGPP